MRSRKFVSMLAIVLLGSALASGVAFAGGGGRGHGGHPRVSVGVAVGPGWWGPRPGWVGPGWGWGAAWGPAWGWGPGWGPGPWGWGPGWGQPVVIQSAPPVFIERDPLPVNPPPPQQVAPAPPPQSGWWYFCPGASGYYPYVRECPGGWQRVSPQPPS
jgi:hypothetical protein